jgi:hypothetical protein
MKMKAGRSRLALSEVNDFSHFSHNPDGLSGSRSLSFAGVVEVDDMPLLR